MDERGVTEVRITATSAARDADNADDVLRCRRGGRRRPARSCSAARRRARSASPAPPPTSTADDGPFLVVDIGGGSTECMVGTDRVEEVRSFDLGCVRLTEKHLDERPARAGGAVQRHRRGDRLVRRPRGARCPRRPPLARSWGWPARSPRSPRSRSAWPEWDRDAHPPLPPHPSRHRGRVPHAGHGVARRPRPQPGSGSGARRRDRRRLLRAGRVRAHAWASTRCWCRRATSSTVSSPAWSPKVPAVPTTATAAWHPPADAWATTRVGRFGTEHGEDALDGLRDRSIADPAGSGTPSSSTSASPSRRRTSRCSTTRRGIPWTTWFAGGRTNLADACCDRWAAATPTADALVWEGEEGATRTLDLRRAAGPGRRPGPAPRPSAACARATRSASTSRCSPRRSPPSWRWPSSGPCSCRCSPATAPRPCASASRTPTPSPSSPPTPSPAGDDRCRCSATALEARRSRPVQHDRRGRPPRRATSQPTSASSPGQRLPTPPFPTAAVDSEHTAVPRLHLGHHRPPQGRRPRPRRLDGEGGRGGRLPDRHRSRRPGVLADRPRLDHGPLAAHGRPGQRRRHPALRRRPRPPRPRPALGLPRRAPGHPLRRQPDPGPGADGRTATTRPAGHDLSRAADPGLHRASRGTRTPGTGTPSRSAASRCPVINISGGTEVGACFLSPHPVRADQPDVARRSEPRDGRRRVRRRRPTGAGRGRRARVHPAVARA